MFAVPHDKDYNVLGFILGPPLFGNYHMEHPTPKVLLHGRIKHFHL